MYQLWVPGETSHGLAIQFVFIAIFTDGAPVVSLPLYSLGEGATDLCVLCLYLSCFRFR